MNNSVYNAYKQNSIMTASPKELVLMIYDAGVRNCNLAIEAFEKNEINKQHMYIVKAQDVNTELKVSLNHDIPISKDLDEKYDFLNDMLVKANILKDVEYVKIAKMMFSEFRDIWKELMKKA